jgi:hypothetical protein
MSLKRLGVVVAAIVVTLGVGVVRDAHADAFGGALIDISNFTLSCSGAGCTNPGGTLDLADFAAGTLSFTDTLTNTAFLTGFSGTPFQQATATTFVATTDAGLACIDNTAGATCAAIGQNNFTIFDTPPPNFTFARADNILAGQPISGTPIGAAGVTANTISETSLNTVNPLGSSNTTEQLTSSFQFQVAHVIDSLDVSFDATAFLQAWTAAGTPAGTQAGANITWSLVLQGSDGSFAQLQPGGTSTNFTITDPTCDLNQSATAGPSSPLAPVINCTNDHFHATLGIALTPGVSYSLTITQTAQTNASETAAVPAPAAVLLLGSSLVGLAGVGYVRRQRSA